jgi:hypothetical protein
MTLRLLAHGARATRQQTKESNQWQPLWVGFDSSNKHTSVGAHDKAAEDKATLTPLDSVMVDFDRPPMTGSFTTNHL